MKEHQPYTYLLRFIPTGQLYYGVRFAKKCHPDELWVTYFSSSKVVKELIECHGKTAFEYEVRSTFIKADKARKCEERVHRWFDVKRSPHWLNRHNAGSLCFTRDVTVETRAKMSESAKKAALKRNPEQYQKTAKALKGRKQSPEHAAAHGAARRGTKQTPETIKKRAAKNKGRIFTDEQKRRMAEGQSGMKMYANIDTFELKRFFDHPGGNWFTWNNKWGLPKEMRETYPRELFTGVPVPIKKAKPRKKYIRTKRISNKERGIPHGAIGKPKSEEHRANLSKSRRGSTRCPEATAKAAEKNRDQTRTAEQILKLKLGQHKFANLETLEVRRFPLESPPDAPWVRWNAAWGVPPDIRATYPKKSFTVLD